MIKTIEELEQESDALEQMIRETDASIAYHQAEALKESGNRIVLRQELDAVESALISALGEPS
ncbi:hypothetical protein SAMN05428970_1986 [Agromyces sp. CF514]|uniref:hypothetical protein n=1 Tax=Agromyces sp. CF514 TaxID=1881031 RepID=UPI0008ED07DC|nr:hypothetical protein [Agromyces sp. CF514]SFR75896.1 hypothetical protein SAMN05428970_1986 [Agromyces sp. CF514]